MSEYEDKRRFAAEQLRRLATDLEAGKVDAVIVGAIGLPTDEREEAHGVSFNIWGEAPSMLVMSSLLRGYMDTMVRNQLDALGAEALH